MTLDESAFLSDPSESSAESSMTDSSIQDFMRGLKSRDSRKEKLNNSTQTLGRKVKKKRREDLPVRRDDGPKNVVAVMAPNPYQRPSTGVSYYAFRESGGMESVRSSMAPSVSSRSGVQSLRGSGGGRMVHDTYSRPDRRPTSAPAPSAAAPRPAHNADRVRVVHEPAPRKPPRAPLTSAVSAKVVPKPPTKTASRAWY
jgi:hypothetical protein